MDESDFRTGDIVLCLPDTNQLLFDAEEYSTVAGDIAGVVVVADSGPSIGVKLDHCATSVADRYVEGGSDVWDKVDGCIVVHVPRELLAIIHREPA